MIDKLGSKTGGSGVEALLNSFQEFNRLNLSTAGKLANFQLDVLQAYADFGFAELRAVLAIKDSKTLKEFVGGRAKVVEELGKRLQADAKTLIDLGNDYSAEAQKLLRANLPTGGSRPVAAAA